MKKVLILDDEKDILELWVSNFKRWEFLVEVHTAENGKEGLKLLEATDGYDLIITDYKMPYMDGLTFISHARALQKDKKTPIFFFTGYMPELKSVSSELENVLFFEKPLITEKMKTHIKMCMA